MYTEPMALTGYIYQNVHTLQGISLLVIYSLGNPSTGSWCAGRLFYCPSVINQHRWETLPNGCT